MILKGEVMELIDRYLQAVKFWLPKAQKQDIIAELSEDIRSQVEEKEAELGRKLNDAEVEAILIQRGSPIVVAKASTLHPCAFDGSSVIMRRTDQMRMAV